MDYRNMKVTKTMKHANGHRKGVLSFVFSWSMRVLISSGVDRDMYAKKREKGVP